jgi:hypothetical protein
MQRKKKILRTLGVIFFAAGILVGMVTFILMSWAYFEAYFFFGTTAPADKPLTTLRCPLLMTTSDTGEVTIRLTNNTSKDLSPSISTDISYMEVYQTTRQNYPLAAGETRTLSWAVTSDDMVLGHLIMARVFVFSAYTLPSQTNTCGTVIVNVPGMSGIQVLVMTMAFILVCMMAGWSLWLISSRPFQTDERIATRAMAFFTIAVVLGLVGGFLGFLGGWLLGLVCAVICLLLIIAVVGYYIQKL